MPVFVDNGPDLARPGRPIGGWCAEQPFQDAAANPTSTFPLIVDATAYPDVRRALLDEKRLPAPGAVRVAGLVNSFAYSYPEPAKWRSGVAHTRPGPVPVERGAPSGPHRFARTARTRSFCGAEVLVAFNSRRVSAYRLIGYEGPRRRESDAIGDTLGAGQPVTALYEIVPRDNTDKGEWLTVKMRYEGAAGRLSRSLNGEAENLDGGLGGFSLRGGGGGVRPATARFGIPRRRDL